MNIAACSTWTSSWRNATRGRNTRPCATASPVRMMICQRPCYCLASTTTYSLYWIQSSVLYVSMVRRQSLDLQETESTCEKEKSIWNKINSLPVDGRTLYGSSDSSGSLDPISFRAKIRIRYSWSSCRSLIWNFWTPAGTRPTSIHMVFLMSRMAML